MSLHPVRIRRIDRFHFLSEEGVGDRYRRYGSDGPGALVLFYLCKRSIAASPSAHLGGKTREENDSSTFQGLPAGSREPPPLRQKLENTFQPPQRDGRASPFRPIRSGSEEDPTLATY